MIQIDVCLEAVFTSLPTEKRIEKIAQAGYRVVEFWFHDATFDGTECSRKQPKNATVLAGVCKKWGITINNMVVNAPDGSVGGAPVRAKDRTRYLERLEEVIEFAAETGCRKAITCSGNLQPGLSRARMRANLEKALGEAAAIAAKKGFSLLLEPLNTRVDHPGYYLDSSTEAAELVRAVASPNLRLLYDVYHMQIMEGNVITTIEKHLNLIGHFHSAGVPGRGELLAGELNYPQILKSIAAMGYQGRFGLEYFPKMKDHLASLRKVRGWLQPCSTE
jgi:hydroxypyruvate isomerase